MKLLRSPIMLGLVLIIIIIKIYYSIDIETVKDSVECKKILDKVYAETERNIEIKDKKFSIFFKSGMRSYKFFIYGVMEERYQNIVIQNFKTAKSGINKPIKLFFYKTNEQIISKQYLPDNSVLIKEIII